MIIKEISIRGFKSYGNADQVIQLNEKGGLILLVGSNGNGKSSIQESMDYCLYNKVRGKKKKWTTLSTLPNRINGELLVKMKLNSNGTNVEIIRGISPNTLKLKENGIENDRAGKSNLDEKIEKYIGLDIETFKSFISMSINDFKNFISLSNEEKQLLLDRLFNLEVINILNGILKDLNKVNKLQSTKFDSEIQTLNESIESIKKSISKSIEKQKQNIQEEIDNIKLEMKSKKEDYEKLRENVEKIKNKEKEIKGEIERERDQYIGLQSEIKNSQKDIDLYNSGKCPTCGTDFNSSHFFDVKDSLIKKRESLNSIKSEIEENIKSLKEKQSKLQEISEKTNKSFNDLTYLLKNYKSQIDKLQISKENDDIKGSEIGEFENTIRELEIKKDNSKEQSIICKEKEIYYKELSKIFGEDGVRKSIISGIIKPINHFISDNIKKMGMPFQVILDETFTADIKHFGNSIEHDSLSTGETKKINISILIAYLKLIRTKKNINVLFLDEVFSGLDLESIQSVLDLLKSFAHEYNINIFVVHHAILNQENFDRIIKINKDVFSTIEEVNILDNE